MQTRRSPSDPRAISCRRRLHGSSRKAIEEWSVHCCSCSHALLESSCCMLTFIFFPSLSVFRRVQLLPSLCRSHHHSTSRRSQWRRRVVRCPLSVQSHSAVYHSLDSCLGLTDLSVLRSQTCVSCHRARVLLLTHPLTSLSSLSALSAPSALITTQARSTEIRRASVRWIDCHLRVGCHAFHGSGIGVIVCVDPQAAGAQAQPGDA